MLKQAESIKGLNELNVLKQEAQKLQGKGLPYMMASVVIWSLICLLNCMNLSVIWVNQFTFMTTCLLLPLAWIFSKLIGADIFRKTSNPVSKLAFLCTMNQNLYLLIVMWACSKAPEAMIMLFAIVFGAHLLPFSWAYDNKAYVVIPIMETIGALAIGCIFGNRIMTFFMIIMQIILCIFLYADVRKANWKIESRN